jgi:hypothetical protein
LVTGLQVCPRPPALARQRPRQLKGLPTSLVKDPAPLPPRALPTTPARRRAGLLHRSCHVPLYHQRPRSAPPVRPSRHRGQSCWGTYISIRSPQPRQAGK